MVLADRCRLREIPAMNAITKDATALEDAEGVLNTSIPAVLAKSTSILIQTHSCTSDDFQISG